MRPVPRLYLVRHPATTIEKPLPPDQWRLSEEGERQLEALLRGSFWSEIQHVYSSTEPKAAAVAERARSVHGLPFSLHAELNELRRPDFVADYPQHVARVFARPGEEVGGWESLESACSRVWAFLVHGTGRGALPAAAVSHGIVLSAVRARLLGAATCDLEDWRRLPFAGVAEVDTESWQLTQDFRPPLP